MRKQTIIVSTVLALTLTGCAQKDINFLPETEVETTAEETVMTETPAVVSEEIRADLSKSCKSIYEQSLENGTFGSLEMVRDMVERLGGDGFAVIDQDNQVDMEGADQVKEFCHKVEEGQPSKLTLITVLNNGGYEEFELSTEDGLVDVTAVSWRWKEKELVYFDSDHYQASSWIYTPNGYLIFEKYYMAGFSGPFGHVAVRVEPLDPICRELNRKYIWPVRYAGNNLFLCDWTEGDYSSLDLCDLFEIFYRLEDPYGIPYAVSSGGDLYQIPGVEFERIMKKYFAVSTKSLRENVRYEAGSGVYEYQPRGMYDSAGGMEAPYPEVVDYEEREDGTLELTINAVWAEMNLGTAFRHKVVIRPMQDGAYQYVSNEIIPSEDNVEPAWYRERMAAE